MADGFLVGDRLEELLIMPEGTVTVYLDKGEFRLYSEPDPDPGDLAAALALAHEHSTGEPPEEYDIDGVIMLVYRASSAGHGRWLGLKRRGRRLLDLAAALLPFLLAILAFNADPF